MISLSNIHVSFAHKELFSDVSFHINPRDRIALVGKNGTGKSTLMKIITGLQEPTSGAVVRDMRLKSGYLPQQMNHAKDKSVLEETLQVFSHITVLTQQMEQINKELARREDYHSEAYDKLIRELADHSDRYRLIASENHSGKAERVLRGLGFKQEEFDRPTATFSEGWNMRIELAKLLLANPDVLLLDEPTNHLDIESLRWLEEYLISYTGALLVVSHDRTFLDTVTERTIELSLGRIYDYKASYSHFMELRRERIEQQTAAYENQQKTIEKTKEFIERFRYKPTKSNQVQSRIKQLEKMELVEIDPVDHTKIRVRFPDPPRSGTVVYTCKDLAAGYNGKPVFTNTSITVERGQKIAFVGRNGEGKTTMLRLLAAQRGELQVLEGSVQIGHNVEAGYYAQNQDELIDKELTVYETVDRIATGDVRTRLREILGSFLFSGDEVDKTTAVLSGGERSRLAMAVLMLQPYNVLLLDEPTNHMDIQSKEVLKEALIAYKGTMVVVSHDRTFLDGLVNKVYEFSYGKVKEHLGGIEVFLERRKLETLQEQETRQRVEEKGLSATKEISEAAQQYQKKKEQERKLRKLQSAVKKIETRIEKQEEKLLQLDEQLHHPPEGGFTIAFYEGYEKEKKGLDMSMKAWETAHNKLDAFLKKIKNG
ncbi:MAG: ABC-F family ATP-binding cassette domain-containing protein [Bacteroidales bacterium]|nr:ABC-F family ATP-binding cassette domain-containing protein [Bacteroidales bacterium]